MDVERIIDDIQQLEEMFEAPDIRPLSASAISAANPRHDECSRIAHGFSFGSVTEFAAARETEAGLGLRASAAFPVLKPIVMLAFRAGLAPAVV